MKTKGRATLLGLVLAATAVALGVPLAQSPTAFRAVPAPTPASCGVVAPCGYIAPVGGQLRDIPPVPDNQTAAAYLADAAARQPAPVTTYLPYGQGTCTAYPCDGLHNLPTAAPVAPVAPAATPIPPPNPIAFGGCDIVIVPIGPPTPALGGGSGARLVKITGGECAVVENPIGGGSSFGAAGAAITVTLAPQLNGPTGIGPQTFSGMTDAHGHFQFYPATAPGLVDTMVPHVTGGTASLNGQTAVYKP